MTRALLIALVLLGFTACNEHSNEEKAPAAFKVASFKSESGWGYIVFIRGKPFIRQPYIPALRGNTPFKREEDALKVGRYVCTLIKTRRLPSVRATDLVKMGIVPDTFSLVPPHDHIR